MIRKIIGITILFISMVSLMLAMDQSFVNKVKQDQYFDHLIADNPCKHTIYHQLFINSDRWKYGDLYGLCFLPAYKIPLDPFATYPKIKKASTNNVLYIIGDSFLADKTLSGAFDKFDNVVFLDRRFAFGPIKLDSTKRNYLIMEFAERNLVDYNISKTPEVQWPRSDIEAKRFNITRNLQTKTNLPTSMLERVNNIIFNKDLSRNLEILLFYNKIFTPFKELKANINYKISGWLPKEVAVSSDKKRLLMNVTVDTTYRQSAFRNITDKEVDTISNALNKAQNYYRSIGFKKVVLSVIPNPASIYDNKKYIYNHLLQRIEETNKFPVIKVFTTYKLTPENLYYKSDGHWNPYGMNIWIRVVNKTLSTE